MTGDFYGDTPDQQITHSMEEHEMTETQRAFRERIGRVMQQSRDRYPEVRHSLAAELDAGEAVYEQALRDMTAWFADDEWIHDGETGSITASIKRFAADKGITLEDTP